MFNIPKLDIRLDQQGLVRIDGVNNDTETARSNGSGKTNVSKILTIVAHNATPGGDSNVVMQGEKSCWGRLDFYVDDKSQAYYIERRRSGASHKVEFIGPDGKPVSDAGGVKATQAAIEDVLGQPFKVFTNTTVFAQGDNRRFADVGIDDKTRKEIMKSLIVLEDVSGIRKSISTSASVLRTTLAERERSIQKVEHAVELIETTIEGKQKLMDREVEAQQDELTSLRAELKQARKANEDISRQRNIVRVGKGVIRKNLRQLAEMDDAESELEKAQELVDSIDADLRDLVNDVARLKREESELTNAIRRLTREADEGLLCPHCGSPMDGEHAAVHRADLKKQRKQTHKSLAAARDKSDTLEAALKTAREARRMAQDVCNKARDLVDSNKDEQAKVDRAKSNIALIEEMSDSIASIKSRIKECKKGDAIAEIAADIEEQKRLRAKRSKLLKARRAKRDRTERELWHHEWCVKAFSDSGLPSFAIEDSLPELNAGVERWLTILAGGDIAAWFTATEELKGGGTRDRISIKTEIEGATDKAPSGAQGKKISLAGSLSLRGMLQERSRQIDFMFIDESLDGLDELAVQSVVDMLLELRKECGTIFVVTHDNSVADVFDRTMLVRKEHGKAQIV